MPAPVAAPAVVEPGAAEAAPRAHPGASRLLKPALVLGAFVGMADATVVAVALQPLSRHYGISLNAAQAVLGIYLVTVTATIPGLGRIGDVVGRRRAYLAGFAVFAGGSVLAAVAPTFGLLLLGRAVQAVGGGLLTAGSLALITEHAPARGTGRSVALLVVAQAVAGLVGPPIGGVLVVLGGWQAVFWAGIPLAGVGVLLTLVAVPPTTGERARRGIDPVGALGLGGLLLGLGAGIGSLRGPDLAGLPAWAWLAVAAAGAALLATAETQVRHPLLDRRLLHGRFAVASVATLLSTGSLMSCFALLPFWLEGAHGASAGLAGAAFVPLAVGMAITSRRGGRLADLGHTRTVTAAGMVVAAVGLGLVAVTAVTGAWPLLGLGLFVLGCGNGLFSSPNTAAAMTVAPRSALGSASAFLSTARNAGVIVGLGATGAAYGAAAGTSGGQHADAAAAGLFGAAALVCLGVAALVLRVYRAPEAA